MSTWEEQQKQVSQRKKAWLEEKAFDFQTALLQAKNEEEVKAAYIREFALPANMQERHDLKVDKVLFEFKYSVDFNNIETSSRIVSQAIYYIRRLYRKGRLDEIRYLIVADKDEVKIFRISELEVFYSSENYNWNDSRPSAPDLVLINAVRDSKVIESNRTYKILEKSDLDIFSKVLYSILSPGRHLKNGTLYSKLKSLKKHFLYLGGIAAFILFLLLFIERFYVADPPNYLTPEQSEKDNL